MDTGARTGVRVHWARQVHDKYAVPILHDSQQPVCSSSGEKERYLQASYFGITCQQIGKGFKYLPSVTVPTPLLIEVPIVSKAY